MPNCSESRKHGRVTRCAICDRKFGLVRYYSWRTPLCSRKCVDRFRDRRTRDRKWISWLQITVGQLTDNGARVS